MGMQTRVKMGVRLRTLRQCRHLSQAALAERAGLSTETVSAIERGKHVPRADTVLALARALACSPEDLFDLWEPPSSHGTETRSPLSRHRQVRIATLLAAVRSLDDSRLDLACRIIAVLAECP